MAGRLRNAMLYLGLVDDEEQDYYDEEYGAAHADAEPDTASVSTVRSRRAATATAVAAPMAAVREDRRPSAPTASSDPYRITTVTPRNYNEARTIGEHFRDGVPVIINLTEMDDADAKRLVDFAAGLTFGLHGRVERVTAKVFLLSPQNVTVTAQDKAKLVEDGFFNQS